MRAGHEVASPPFAWHGDGAYQFRPHGHAVAPDDSKSDNGRRSRSDSPPTAEGYRPWWGSASLVRMVYPERPRSTPLRGRLRSWHEGGPDVVTGSQFFMRVCSRPPGRNLVHVHRPVPRPAHAPPAADDVNDYLTRI